MLQNIHIDVRNVSLPDYLARKIEEGIERLEHHAGQPVTSARAEVIATPHHRRGAYELRLVVSVPGGVLTVRRSGDLGTPLVMEVFDALDRQLREHNRVRQQIVKRHHTNALHGTITRINVLDAFGFLRADEPGTLDVYFHKNAVKNAEFEKLRAGQHATCGIEDGDKGPQATWLRVDR